MTTTAYLEALDHVDRVLTETATTATDSGYLYAAAFGFIRGATNRLTPAQVVALIDYTNRAILTHIDLMATQHLTQVPA